MKRLCFNGFIINSKSNYYKINEINDVLRNDYYFLSNDVIKTSQFKVKDLESAAFIGLANIHSLHVLSNVSKRNRINKIIFVDINPSQLLHFRILYI